ncbi:hypothetical protein NSQ95_05520 [Psychrobacillus sp. FSL W7-1457]|uniref:hypothetical protein n=1 Tax=Psychrobacillus sp. FSL W7-1457 TaxID=2954547 RepID=UPI003159D11C
MRKKIVVIVAIVIVSIFVLVDLFMEDLWESNENLLKEEVLSIEESVENINFNELTPFEWDVAYAFDPYTTNDTIYETVGYKWDKIRETINEGMNQIVFLKDGKVVCYLYGYPENNGYGIYFTQENRTEISSASVINSKDDLVFQVVRSNNVIYLENKVRKK